MSLSWETSVGSCFQNFLSDLAGGFLTVSDLGVWDGGRDWGLWSSAKRSLHG